MKETYLIYTGDYSENFTGWVCTEGNREDVVKHMLTEGGYNVYIEHGQLVGLTFTPLISEIVRVNISYIDTYGDAETTEWKLIIASTIA